MKRLEEAKEFNAKYHLPIVEWTRQFERDCYEEAQMRVSPNKDALSVTTGMTKIDPALDSFYYGLKDWIIRWKFKNTFTHAPEGLVGAVKMLPIEDVLNWRAWNLFTPEFPQMENFTLLDYFDDNAAVGFYLNQPERGLFYFAFDADPKPLNLDFKGYLEMIKFTKGAAFWQLSCIEPINESTCRTVEKLNQIDPEITVEGFYELYDQVKSK